MYKITIINTSIILINGGNYLEILEEDIVYKLLIEAKVLY